MAPTNYRLVVFDLDGTLTRPFLNFARIHAAIGLPEPVLESMLALPPGPDRDRAFALLEGFEDEAAEASELNEDVHEVLDFLARRSIPSAIFTRNSRRSAEVTLKKHALSFHVVMTRDDAPPKPRPEPLWLICDRLGVRPDQALMVGDFKYDVLAGRNAGMATALLTHGKLPAYLEEISPDHLLARLSDLPPLMGWRN